MKSNRAFTLIELLVVIAIIGILAAIIFLNVTGARSQAHDTAVKANLTNIETALNQFAGNHNESFGVSDDGGGGAILCPLPGDSSGTGVFYDPAIEDNIATTLTNSPGGTAWCFSANDAFALAVSRPAELNASKSYFWCVDSTGNKCGNNGDQGDPTFPPIIGGACVPCTVTD